MKRNLISRIILVAFVVMSVATTILATAREGVDTSNEMISDTFTPDVKVSLHVPLQSTDNLSLGAVTESSDSEKSSSELNRELTNPVSSLWSIANQFNNFELNNGHWSNNWNFQPVLPLSLTKDWNLITRPLMPFYDIVPHPTESGEWERDAGLGDLALVEILSPAQSGNWLLGVGPTFIFPTAISRFTGQRKWQLGPTGLIWIHDKELYYRRVSSAVVVSWRRA